MSTLGTLKLTAETKPQHIVDFPHYGRHRYSLIKHSGGNDGKRTICCRV